MAHCHHAKLACKAGPGGPLGGSKPHFCSRRLKSSLVSSKEAGPLRLPPRVSEVCCPRPLPGPLPRPQSPPLPPTKPTPAPMATVSWDLAALLAAGASPEVPVPPAEIGPPPADHAFSVSSHTRREAQVLRQGNNGLTLEARAAPPGSVRGHLAIATAKSAHHCGFSRITWNSTDLKSKITSICHIKRLSVPLTYRHLTATAGMLSQRVGSFTPQTPKNPAPDWVVTPPDAGWYNLGQNGQGKALNSTLKVVIGQCDCHVSKCCGCMQLPVSICWIEVILSRGIPIRPQRTWGVAICSAALLAFVVELCDCVGGHMTGRYVQCSPLPPRIKDVDLTDGTFVQEPYLHAYRSHSSITSTQSAFIAMQRTYARQVIQEIGLMINTTDVAEEHYGILPPLQKHLLGGHTYCCCPPTGVTRQ